MVYLFCGVFGGALLAAVVIPLFRKDDTLDSAIMEETEWDLLQRKKEVILGNIQDLDFEYKYVRAGMSAEAAAVLRQIDEIEQSRDLDALIRREVSDRRGRARGATTTLDCPGCGSRNPVSNKF